MLWLVQKNVVCHVCLGYANQWLAQDTHTGHAQTHTYTHTWYYMHIGAGMLGGSYTYFNQLLELENSSKIANLSSVVVFGCIGVKVNGFPKVQIWCRDSDFDL